MKLVAAARLRRAQDAIIAARPYANALADAVVRGRRCAPAPTRTRCSTQRAAKRVDAGRAHAPTAAWRAASTPTSSAPSQRFVAERSRRRRRTRDRAADRRQEGARLLPPPQARRSATSSPAPTARDRARSSRASWRRSSSHDFHDGRRSTRSTSSTTSSRSRCTQRGAWSSRSCRSRAPTCAPRRGGADRPRLDFLYEPSKDAAARRAPAAVRRVADLPRPARVDRRRASARA